MDFGASQAINEGSSAVFSATLADTAGDVIDSSSVTAITATLVDAASGTVIRSAQNVNGTNGGTLGEDGAFTLELSGDDVEAIGTRRYQLRRLTIEVTFNGGVLTSQSTFYVRNLSDYPAS